MSTKYTKRSLFDFEGLTENTVAPASPKTKKKKERIPFYIKALDEGSTGLTVEAAENTVAINTTNLTEAIFDKNEIIYDDDLKLPEEAQVVKQEQLPEGNYKSIWKSPKIRPNVDFEEEIDDGEFDFDDEELDCDIDAPPIKTNKHRSLYTYHIQPKTQLSSTPEEPIEEEPVGEKTYDPEPAGKYVEVVDELQDTLRKMKKKSLLESAKNIELWGTPPTSEKATTIHKNISTLLEKPINEV